MIMPLKPLYATRRISEKVDLEGIAWLTGQPARLLPTARTVVLVALKLAEGEGRACRENIRRRFEARMREHLELVHEMAGLDDAETVVFCPLRECFYVHGPSTKSE